MIKEVIQNLPNYSNELIHLNILVKEDVLSMSKNVTLMRDYYIDEFKIESLPDIKLKKYTEIISNEVGSILGEKTIFKVMRYRKGKKKQKEIPVCGKYCRYQSNHYVDEKLCFLYNFINSFRHFIPVSYVETPDMYMILVNKVLLKKIEELLGDKF